MSLNIEECTLGEICAGNGVGVKLLEELRDKLEEWLSMQPHLPKDMSKRRMENIIILSKFSLEKSKRYFERYYTIRSLIPELFRDRDPNSARMTRAFNTAAFVSLPKLTPEMYSVSIYNMINSDISQFDFFDLAKVGFMVLEIRLNECRYTMGDILILDCRGFTHHHLAKLTPTLIKKIIIAVMHGIGTRAKALHYINAPTYMDRIVSTMKIFLPQKFHRMVYVHRAGNMESLFEMVPRSILPKDYGGDERPMSELQDLWREKLGKWRNWLIEQETVLVNENLRPGPAVNGNDLFGFSGSFRKLDID